MLKRRLEDESHSKSGKARGRLVRVPRGWEWTGSIRGYQRIFRISAAGRTLTTAPLGGDGRRHVPRMLASHPVLSDPYKHHL